MSLTQRAVIGCCLAVASLAAVAGACRTANAAQPGTGNPTAASKSLPVYTFLVQSGFSRRAHPEAAVLRGVITVRRGGQSVVTSTVRTLYRKHQPETLDAIQAAILNGTPTEACETVKVGTLEVAYSDGKVLTVTLYQAYFEITTSAGTMRFTSEPLATILLELLK